VADNAPVTRSPPPPDRRRFATLAVAVALVVAQAGGYLHEMTATHGVCLEHGELVEVDHAQAGTAALPRDDRGIRLERTPTDVAGEHGHCAVALNRGQGATPTASAVQFPAPTLSSNAPAVPVRPLVAQWAIFRLAPKSSPPAA
jgi:hypothetical protein